MADDDEDDNRRTLTRTHIARGAKIIAAGPSPIMPCTVQNITGGGACLLVANTSSVPETFDLTFEHGRTRRPCRVVWRTNDKLGVVFEPAEAAARG
jgi:hypothetical protein